MRLQRLEKSETCLVKMPVHVLVSMQAPLIPAILANIFHYMHAQTAGGSSRLHPCFVLVENTFRYYSAWYERAHYIWIAISTIDWQHLFTGRHETPRQVHVAEIDISLYCAQEISGSKYCQTYYALSACTNKESRSFINLISCKI